MKTRTFLEICNNVAIELRFEKFVSVVSNEDKNAEFVGLMVQQGIERDVASYHPWASLRRQAGVPFSAGRDIYGLPDDFDYIINNTAWDTVKQAPAEGPMDPVDWSALKGSTSLASSIRTITFTILGGTNAVGALQPGNVQQMAVLPVPAQATSGPAITYMYVSEDRVLDASGKLKPWFTDDADIPLFDADLVELAGLVRALRSLGLRFADQMDELQAKLKSEARRDGGRRTATVAGHVGKVLMSSTPGHTRVR